MDFVVNGNEVRCLREKRDGSGESVCIVTFDQHLEAIAPHVCAVLSAHEQQELQDWLELRRRSHSQPMTALMVEALPDLLLQARDAVISGVEIDQKLFAELELALEQFRSTLNARR